MKTIRRVMLIERPIDVVFPYIADRTKLPEWEAPAQSATKVTEGDLGAGTQFLIHNEFMGRRFDVPHEILEYLPPKTVTVRAKSRFLEARTIANFESVPSGTELNLAVEVYAHGPLRLVEPLLVSRMFVRRLYADLDNLKRILEQGRPGPAG